MDISASRSLSGKSSLQASALSKETAVPKLFFRADAKNVPASYSPAVEIPETFASMG